MYFYLEGHLLGHFVCIYIFLQFLYVHISTYLIIACKKKKQLEFNFPTNLEDEVLKLCFSVEVILLLLNGSCQGEHVCVCVVCSGDVLIKSPCSKALRDFMQYSWES